MNYSDKYVIGEAIKRRIKTKINLRGWGEYSLTRLCKQSVCKNDFV